MCPKYENLKEPINFLSYNKFLKKSLEPFCINFEKVTFWLKFAPFGPKMGEGGLFSSKNLFRKLLSISIFKTSCQISRKSLEPFPGKVRHRQTNIQTDKSDFIGPIPVNRRPKKNLTTVFAEIEEKYNFGTNLPPFGPRGDLKKI